LNQYSLKIRSAIPAVSTITSLLRRDQTLTKHSAPKMNNNKK